MGKLESITIIIVCLALAPLAFANALQLGIPARTCRSEPPPASWSGRPPVAAYLLPSASRVLPIIDVTPPAATLMVSACNGDLIGRPLLSDAQAAARVMQTPRSRIETGPGAAANAAANAYYYNISQRDPSGYATQLASFHAAWGRDPIMQRVDGVCLLGRNPTTAEILQWAAAKWGISPLVLYAEATNDGGWDMTSIGDFGCSVGVAQVANCNNAQRPNHVIRGLAGPASVLPAENTCFNVDLFAAFLFKRYVGNGCARGNLALALQQWARGWSACAPEHFAQATCHSIATHDWTTRFFRGASVPYREEPGAPR